MRSKPDSVSFAVGVETRAASVGEALKTNSRSIEAVLAVLKSSGVKADEMQTSELDASPVTTDSGRLAGFRVANLVTVRRNDVTSAPALVDAAVAAGANQVTGLSFFVADPSTRRKEGFELALKDARAKAEALASPSGRKVGDIVCVSEEVGEDAYTRLASLGYMSKPLLEPGSHDSTFSVSLTFDLR